MTSRRVPLRSFTLNPSPEPEAAGPLPDAGISHRLTFLLYRAMAALIDATAPYYRSFGLSIPAARALVSLSEGGGAMTVGRLSGVTGIDLSTISHLLRRIEALGYVSRARQGSDNRVVVISLTAAGAKVAETCRDASLRHEAILLSGIAAPDAALLKQLLCTIHDNVRLDPDLAQKADAQPMVDRSRSLPTQGKASRNR